MKTFTIILLISFMREAFHSTYAIQALNDQRIELIQKTMKQLLGLGNIPKNGILLYIVLKNYFFIV